MRLLRTLASACAMAAAFEAAAQSAGPLVFSDAFNTPDACREHFGSFDWMCALYENDEDIALLYERPFWELASLRTARMDLDADGLEDLVIYEQVRGSCGSAGCPYAFIFGGQPEPKSNSLYGIHSKSDPGAFPAIVERDGERGIIFAPDTLFHPIVALKQNALAHIETMNAACAQTRCP